MGMCGGVIVVLVWVGLSVMYASLCVWLSLFLYTCTPCGKIKEPIFFCVHLFNT